MDQTGQRSEREREEKSPKYKRNLANDRLHDLTCFIKQQVFGPVKCKIRIARCKLPIAFIKQTLF